MTTEIHSQRLAVPAPGPVRPALHAMLEARSVAIVGASARPDSFGARMLDEVGKSPANPVIHLVNPRYQEINGTRCYPSLADLPEPADLVLLGIPDAAVEQQLTLAAATGCHSAVIFGNAHEAPPSSDPGTGLRQRLAAIALSAGMEVCGAGCMGFANVSHGLRAMGYLEPDPLPAGPIALVTHSGSVFSALLRTRRALGFTLAVSSGQELVTAAPSYLSYALDQPATKVLALVLEAIRQPAMLRDVLARAAQRDLPVVLLTAGNSASGRAMVAAHSGALAGTDGGWEALARSYGVHRVGDLAELADTLELFALQTRPRRRVASDPAQSSPAQSSPAQSSPAQSSPADPRPGRTRGIATVHDSGLERAHAADVADETGVPFAAISEHTKARLTELLDPGLLATNPLDVWGTGASARELFRDCLVALADDESVDVVALAVDLVTELDADDSYQLAVLDAARRTDKPVVVVSNLPSAIDPETAALLRGGGIAVLEGMRTGMLALRHLLDHHNRPQPPATEPPTSPDAATGTPATSTAASSTAAVGRPANGRAGRARELLGRCSETGAAQLALLREYGIPTAHTERARSAEAVLAAAARIGYPVVLKTDEPGIAHKSDAGGVILGIGTEPELAAAYADLAARLGPAALVCETVPSGTELALGIASDPDLGPLIVVGAGGILVELIADRAVALPPLSLAQAADLLEGLKVRKLLGGVRGAPPADLGAIASAIAGLAELAVELGQDITALDVNPLICGPRGAVAVDALVISR